DDHGDILLAVDGISDGTRAGHVVEAHFPKHFSIGVVIGADEAIERTIEDDATSSGERAGGLRRTLALGPDYFAGHQVNGLEAAIFTVAVGAGPDGGVDARRQKRPLAWRRGNEIHAGFDQGYVEDLGVGIVG